MSTTLYNLNIFLYWATHPNLNFIHKHFISLMRICQVWSYFWASAQTYDCLCQWVHTIVLMSCYLFRSLYILCTACRILAYRLMFFVLHTTRNKAYLILSYLTLITPFSHDIFRKISLPHISVSLLFILYCYNPQIRCIILLLMRFRTTL